MSQNPSSALRHDVSNASSGAGGGINDQGELCAGCRGQRPGAGRPRSWLGESVFWFLNGA